jgi:hypothetical protein
MVCASRRSGFTTAGAIFEHHTKVLCQRERLLPPPITVVCFSITALCTLLCILFFVLRNKSVFSPLLSQLSPSIFGNKIDMSFLHPKWDEAVEDVSFP